MRIALKDIQGVDAPSYSGRRTFGLVAVVVVGLLTLFIFGMVTAMDTT